MMPLELLAWLTLWLALAEKGTAQRCLGGYEWMNNQMDQSPCIVAGWILGSSLESMGQRVNPPVDIGTFSTSGQYPQPGSPGTTVDAMTCSWVFYNAVQACAFCQGGRAQSWQTWSGTRCQTAGLTSSDSYWPTNITMDRRTAYPQYTIYDPTRWLNGMFDLTEARQIASQNLDDVTDTSAPQPNPSAGSSNPPPRGDNSSQGISAGVLAGAIVGGIIGLALLAALIWWLAFERPRNKRMRVRKDIDLNSEKGVPPPTPDGITGAKIEPFSFAHAPNMQTMPMGSAGMYQTAPGVSPAAYTPLALNSPPLPVSYSPSHTPPPQLGLITTFAPTNSALANQVPNPLIDEKRRRREHRSNSTDAYARANPSPYVGYAFNLPQQVPYEKPGDSSTPKPFPETDPTKRTGANEKGKGKSDTTTKLYPTNLGSDILSDASHSEYDHDQINNSSNNPDGANSNVMRSLSAYQPTHWTAGHVDAFISANPGARPATGRDREMPPPTY